MSWINFRTLSATALALSFHFSAVGQAGLIKSIHWYKLKATGEQFEGVDLNETQAELWVYNKDLNQSKRQIFEIKDLFKALDFEAAGIKGRHKVLVRTPYTNEALCSLYRIYEDEEIFFFCNESVPTPFGNQFGRLHYKGHLKTSMLELNDFQGFKKGDMVSLKEKVSEKKAGSQWRIKHIFANGRVFLEPGFAPLLRPFGDISGPITNVENLNVVEIKENRNSESF